MGTSLGKLCFGAILSTCAAGQTAEQIDKSQFHLLNPTPRELMREFSTDRPDKTESAYSVDAGHFQIEMDVLTYSYDRYNGLPGNTSVEAVSIAPVNLKVGLLNNVDFQLVLQTYTSVRFHDRTAGLVEERRGFGDVIPRLKVNLWGNDGGKTAFALMPYVKIPANQDGLGNNSVEGGIIAPLAVELPYEFGLGLMTQVDILRDADGSGYHPQFVNTITLAHDIYGNLGGFIELFTAVSTEEDSDWVGTLDLGLTYMLTRDIQLDAGVYLGVTQSAPDVAPFLGISFRF